MTHRQLPELARHPFLRFLEHPLLYLHLDALCQYAFDLLVRVLPTYLLSLCWAEVGNIRLLSGARSRRGQTNWGGLWVQSSR